MQSNVVVTIADAVESYAGRTAGAGAAAPYDGASLAAIYGERVQQLLDLQDQGFTHAEWKWDAEIRCNHWHGAAIEGAQR